MQLPICSMEQEIVEAIIQEDVMILCGETGSGKSTQLPQYLSEIYSNCIVCTQPRRVAAVTIAERVARLKAEKEAKEAGK
jgi:HrpA-like RNA helicase